MYPQRLSGQLHSFCMSMDRCFYLHALYFAQQYCCVLQSNLISFKCNEAVYLDSNTKTHRVFVSIEALKC